MKNDYSVFSKRTLHANATLADYNYPTGIELPKSPREDELTVCPGCGVKLQIPPDRDRFYCRHCGTLIIRRKKDPVIWPQPAQEAPKSSPFKNEFTACPGCGAKVQIPPGRDHVFCRYCGTRVINSKKESDVRPQPAQEAPRVSPRRNEYVFCPGCGAKLQIPPGRDHVFCRYCGTRIAGPKK